MFKKEKNRLTKFLEDNPDAPLKTVLLNPDLSISLRNEASALFKYLFPDNGDRKNLNELIDWALTNKNNKDDGDFIYNRNATNVFTCVSKKFHNKLYEDNNKTFDKRLVKFIDDTDYNESPSFSGQYTSILLQHARQTDFKFFIDNPKFYKKILEHVHLLSYQRAFIDLVSDGLSSDAKLNAEQIVNDIPKYAERNDLLDEEISHGIFSCLDTIIKDSAPEVTELFSKNNTFLDGIVSAALKLKKPNVIIDAFKALEELFKNVQPKIKDLVTRTKAVDFQKLIDENQKLKAISYYPIFWKKGIEVMTPFFFENVDERTGLIPNSRFCKSYVNTFKQMSFKDRLYYAEKLDLVNKISEFSNKVRFNGLIYKLVIALSKPPNKDESKYLYEPSAIHKFNSEDWENLVMKYTEYYDKLKIEKYQQLGFEKKTSDYY